ncbi:MAG: hypothetical protein ACKO3N_15505, partial [Verrucomicrobiota bacterium]
GWEPVWGGTTGLRLPGHLRAAAVAYLDRDGRPDLLVTEHGAASHLLRNQTGRAGHRVRVRRAAGTGNPDGLGGTLRWETAPGRFLVRPILAGGGYQSQSADLLVPAGGAAGVGEVLWPGGRRQAFRLDPGARDTVVDEPAPTPPP